jgi:cutinase
MFVPVFALIVALLIPVQHADVVGCEDVYVIGVRGSGQTGYGDQVGTVVVDTVANVRQTGLSAGDHSLDYPAISIADSFGLALLNGDYTRSVAAGADRLLSDLDAIREQCPLTQIVLVGYSQGAQVIKMAMEDRPPIDRITAVVLLADPTREVLQRGILRLGAALDGSGAFGSISLPDHLRTVTVDACAVGDGICGNGGFLSHIDGYEELADSVVQYILSTMTRSLLEHVRPI